MFPLSYAGLLRSIESAETFSTVTWSSPYFVELKVSILEPAELERAVSLRGVDACQRSRRAKTLLEFDQ